MSALLSNAPLKASAWWSYKIPPLLAVAYFALVAAPRPPRFSATAWYFVLYIIAVMAIAAFGHLLTDAFDVEEDRVLGKQNLWAPLSPAARSALIVLLFAVSWLPWMAMPGGPVLLGLIALQFVMFFLYAAPPIRLKERGLPGIVADSAYAHMLPALWTWIPFSHLAGVRAPVWFLGILAGWSLAVGMRHLLQHQLAQFESDSSARVATHAVRRGRASTLALIVRGVLPVEMALFAAMLVTIGARLPIVAAGFVLFAAWRAIKPRATRTRGVEADGIDARLSSELGTLVLTRFYERWLPVLILVGLVAIEPSYIVLLVIHLALFGRGVIELLRDDLPNAVAHLRSRRVSRGNDDTSRSTA